MSGVTVVIKKEKISASGSGGGDGGNPNDGCGNPNDGCNGGDENNAHSRTMEALKAGPQTVLKVIGEEVTALKIMYA